MRRLLTLAVLIPLIPALGGCLAAAAGYGIAKATGGEDTYVCEDAPHAESQSELAEMMASDAPDYVNWSGDHVSIEREGKVEVKERTQMVVFVESEDFDGRRYWIPFSALCRR